MKKYLNTTKGKLLITAFGIIFIFILWILISISVKNNLFPNPIRTFNKLRYLFTTNELWISLGQTFGRLILSFLISFVLALIFGILGGIFPSVYRFLSPLITVLKTLPVVAIIFVLIIFLKPKSTLYIMNILVMFPILYEAVRSGVRNVNKDFIDQLKIESSTHSSFSIFNIYIPLAAPSIMLGTVQTLGLGMKVSLMSEILVGSNSYEGLGRIIFRAYQIADMETIFAVVFISIIIIAIFDISLKLLKDKLKRV